MLIRVAPLSSRGDFTHYLLRLGCTVTWLDEQMLEVCVTHPDTVEDEPSALEEWCRAWVDSPRARGRVLEIDPPREHKSSAKTLGGLQFA